MASPPGERLGPSGNFTSQRSRPTVAVSSSAASRSATCSSRTDGEPLGDVVAASDATGCRSTLRPTAVLPDRRDFPSSSSARFLGSTGTSSGDIARSCTRRTILCRLSRSSESGAAVPVFAAGVCSAVSVAVCVDNFRDWPFSLRFSSASSSEHMKPAIYFACRFSITRLCL